MQIGPHSVGVCTWSLQPTDTAHLIGMIRELGLSHLQLALWPIVGLDDAKRAEALALLKGSGLTITATAMGFPGEDYSTIDSIRRTGGYVPDELWDERKQLSLDAALLSAELGVKKFTTHIGFVPHPGQPGYDTILNRVREIAVMLQSHGLELLLETGQERAEELLAFLKAVDQPNVFINFDPANLILYGLGDPIEALSLVAPYIRHVHVKDATASAKPGVEWGEEVPFGTGQVGAKRFLDAIKAIGYTGPLAIEREAGTQRLADVRTAIHALQTA